jgi:hypothetical protein
LKRQQLKHSGQQHVLAALIPEGLVHSTAVGIAYVMSPGVPHVWTLPALTSRTAVRIESDLREELEEVHNLITQHSR